MPTLHAVPEERLYVRVTYLNHKCMGTYMFASPMIDTPEYMFASSMIGFFSLSPWGSERNSTTLPLE